MPAEASRDIAVRSTPWQPIFAISVANALEWFDFVIFGYFAAIISANFFPVGNEATSLLLALATFGVAFLVRPLGATILGSYADRHGRKPALLLTISLMVTGTGIIAFAPTYSSVGLFAPALVVCGRVLQGFSAGGEFGGTTAYLVEQNPDRRGFFSSWQFAGQAFAALLANLCGVILTNALSAEQLASWGWRIPFLFGLLIALVAYYIRRQLDESPEFQLAERSVTPFGELLSGALERLLIAIGFVLIATVATYTLVFMPSFAVSQLGLPLSAAFLAGLLTSSIQMVLIPIVGALSDRWGRLPIAYIMVLAILVLAYPLFNWLISVPTLGTLLAFQVVIGLLLAGYGGVLPALMSDIFPTRIRTTGLSISYALSVSLFGGLAPFIDASLAEIIGSKVAAVYYVMIAAVISLSALGAARWRGYV